MTSQAANEYFEEHGLAIGDLREFTDRRGLPAIKFTVTQAATGNTLDFNCGAGAFLPEIDFISDKPEEYGKNMFLVFYRNFVDMWHLNTMEDVLAKCEGATENTSEYKFFTLQYCQAFGIEAAKQLEFVYPLWGDETDDPEATVYRKVGNGEWEFLESGTQEFCDKQVSALIYQYFAAQNWQPEFQDQIENLGNQWKTLGEVAFGGIAYQLSVKGNEDESL